MQRPMERREDQVAEHIRSRIDGGEWEVGVRLPTQKEFAAQYGVSESIVHRAIRLLKSDGLIVTVQGGRMRIPVPAEPDTAVVPKTRRPKRPRRA